MIQSRIRCYIFLFKKNDAKAKVLIDIDYADVPIRDIHENTTIKDLLNDICHRYKLSCNTDSFKLVDCQIVDTKLDICYYAILPFDHYDPSQHFIDVDDLELPEFNNLLKTIRLL